MYPDAWDNPGISSIYLHETSSGCCDKFFAGNVEACSAVDVCAEMDTIEGVANADTIIHAHPTLGTPKQ